MSLNALTPELLVAFEAIVGPANVLTAQRAEAAATADVYADYGRDHTEDLYFAPDVVLPGRYRRNQPDNAPVPRAPHSCYAPRGWHGP